MWSVKHHAMKTHGPAEVQLHARDLPEIEARYLSRAVSHYSNDATAPSGPGPPHRDFMITHIWDTPHSVGLLCTSDQSVAETSTWQNTTLTRDRQSCPRRDIFFFWSILYFYKSFRPSSCHFMFHTLFLYNKYNANIHAPGGIFFCLPVRGFSPLIHFCTV
jgi:hypothetical protein